MAVGIVYVLVLLWIPLFAVLPPSPPVFSWDTLPLFVHVANQGGPLSTTQAQFMASFPLATIDKKQDVAKNKTSCTLGINCEEDKIIDALKQIRSYNITAYYREFEHGVSVWLEQNGKHPCIKWNATYFTGKIEDCRLYNSSISKS
eukprot:449816_1